MRFLLCVSLGCLLIACSPATNDRANTGTDPDQSPTEEGPATAETEAVAGEQAPTEVGAITVLEGIRQEYARLQRLLEEGKLNSDSIQYSCEDAMIEGTVKRYTEAGNVVIVVNGYAEGDHGGVTDHYYFRDGEPFFLFREKGYWVFGGPLQSLEDGTEVPGTIDKLTEERYYIHDGKTIEALTKYYEIRSGETVEPASIPNQQMSHNGDLPTNYPFIRSVLDKRKADCRLLRD